MLIDTSFSLLIALLSLHTVFCECNETYVMLCECLSDFEDYKTSNWTDVIVDGSRTSCLASNISRNDVVDLEAIKLLIVSKQVNSISPKTFTTVGQTLKYLSFYGNNLDTIQTATFAGFRKLSFLRLIQNNIKTIQACAFDSSVIKHLDLTNNLLEVLPEDAFRNAKIATISIRNNKLSVIDKKAFNNDLEVLHLDYNNLETVQSGFLSKLPLLKELTLNHNRLAHISDLSSLERLQKLDLSFNNINFIEAKEFEDLKRLAHLDLSSNRLESFALKAFKKSKVERITLLLSYNMLTNLKIPNDVKPMTVTLYGNPWNCKCWNEIQSKMAALGFSRTKCDGYLFKIGTMPVCIDQGECTNDPVQNRDDLRRFSWITKRKMDQLSCDLFGDVVVSS